MRRSLVVCADDLGRTPGINRGVLAAHEHGIVTSASLMVRWDAAAAAASIAGRHPRLALGLHLDLGEWIYRDGDWHEVYRVVDPEDRAAVEREVARQLERFERIVGRPPTHLDSHQHVHRDEPVRSALARAGRRLGVPVRGLSERVRYRGDFHGQTGRGEPFPQGITVEALIDLIGTLPAGTTELGVHPGEAEGLDSPYREERFVEVQVLCDPRVRVALQDEGVDLVSFADVAQDCRSRLSG